MISQRTIEEVKRRTSLVEVVSEVVVLKSAGSHYVGLCPFHSEKTPSFTVKEDSGFYYCFGCGASGGVFRFLQETKGLSFPEAVEFLAERAGVPLERAEGRAARVPKRNDDRYYDLHHAAQVYFRAQLKKAPEVVTRYLTSRGLAPALMEQFGVGFAPLEWRGLLEILRREKKATDEELLAAGLARRSQRGELFDMFRGRVTFPIFVDRKHIAGFGARFVPGLEERETEGPKYLNTPESEVYKKSEVLFNLPFALQSIRSSNRIFIVEGYLDVISLVGQGIENVAATCGTALTADHVRRLKRLAKRVMILFDGDTAGRRAAARVYPLFLNAGLDGFALFLPEGEDPDTLARRCGGETAAALEGLPRKTLFECYLDGLIARQGSTNSTELGSASRAAVAGDLALLLAKVESDIEREELIKQTAFLLRIDEEKFSVLVREQRSGGQYSSGAGSANRDRVSGDRVSGDWVSVGDLSSRAASAVGGSAETSSFSHATAGDGAEDPSAIERLENEQAPDVATLSRLDRELLKVVMAGRETFPQRVLQDPQFVDGLSPATFAFIGDLAIAMGAVATEAVTREAVASGERGANPGVAAQEGAVVPSSHEGARERVSALLRRYGKSWVDLWREAQRLREDEDAQLEEGFVQCCKTVKRRKVEQALEILQSQIRYTTDPDQKMFLSQRVVELSRERQLLSASN